MANLFVVSTPIGNLKDLSARAGEILGSVARIFAEDTRRTRVLLDHLRRSLAIKEDALNPNYQDRISEQSRQRLCDPWVIEDSRDMVRAGVAWPRSRCLGCRLV